MQVSRLTESNLQPPSSDHKGDLVWPLPPDTHCFPGREPKQAGPAAGGGFRVAPLGSCQYLAHKLQLPWEPHPGHLGWQGRAARKIPRIPSPAMRTPLHRKGKAEPSAPHRLSTGPRHPHQDSHCTLESPWSFLKAKPSEQDMCTWGQGTVHSASFRVCRCSTCRVSHSWVEMRPNRVPSSLYLSLLRNSTA